MAITRLNSLAIPSGTITADNLAEGAAPGSGENLLINGCMRVWQRGTDAVTVGSSVTYVPDRFFVYAQGATVTAQYQEITLDGFSFATRITGASGVTDAELSQRVEALNVKHLVGGSVTVSFYAKASSALTATVKLFHADAEDDFSYITSISTDTVSVGTSFARHSVTFSSLPANTANGLQVGIYTGALGASETIDITGVKMESGTSVTDFVFTTYADELAKCQRYYFNMGSIDFHGWNHNVADTSGSRAAQVTAFPVTMRVNPSLSCDDGAGNANKFWYQTPTQSYGNNLTPWVYINTNRINAGLRYPYGAIYGSLGDSMLFGFANGKLNAAL